MAVTGGASKKQRTERRDALEVLPGSAWVLVLKKLDDYDHLGFGLTCRTFLEAVTKATSPEEKKKARLRTDLSQEKLFDQVPSFTLGWYQRMFQSFKRKKSRRFERKKGARFNFVPLYGHSNYLYLSDYTYDVELMYLAAFQGSKKVMKWLVSQGIPLGIILRGLPHEER
uniref:F-box domain-containing protein n=1 Tax=Chloropicon primus TaxID=1764295 RepID=A0A7S2WXV6_9CHLO|mmetsp:Transcript_14262/g.40483  ORF Transcript_14262/g.40483 Transcript_14262/m.40483 type:complete len:170 (+) Transcript_14262:401-910(+)